MTIVDKKNDGNNVYGKTEFYWWKPEGITGPTKWVSGGVKSTGEWANVTKTVTVKVSLDPVAEKSRAVSKACAQMGWPVPGSCGQAVTSWDD